MCCPGLDGAHIILGNGDASNFRHLRLDAGRSPCRGRPEQSNGPVSRSSRFSLIPLWAASSEFAGELRPRAGLGVERYGIRLMGPFATADEAANWS